MLVLYADIVDQPGDTSSEPSIATTDRVRVTFDDDNLVANAGLLLPATLTELLGLESLINTTVDLSGRTGGASRPSQIGRAHV